MDNNEIPPYDIPFNNDDSVNDGQSMSKSDNNMSDSSLTENFTENFEDNIDFQEQTTGDSEQDSEIHGNPNIQVQDIPKKNGSSIFVLLGIVLFLVIVLAGALVYIYADTLNIPYLSNKDSTKIDTMNLNESEVNGLDTLPQEEGESLANAETENSLDEGSEDTGIEITRDRQEPVKTPEKRNKNEDVLPSLTGVNNNDMQNNQIANTRYYTGGTVGRIDPFNPRNGSGADMFEIIVPPVDPKPDLETQALMSLKITGIMYTPDSPSAIINIAGQDQLVRKGDKFNGFSVLGITKDKVTVKTGVNVYTAAVGEILNIDQVGINAIPNLGRKFAGPYSKGKDKIIEINMID